MYNNNNKITKNKKKLIKKALFSGWTEKKKEKNAYKNRY